MQAQYLLVCLSCQTVMPEKAGSSDVFLGARLPLSIKAGTKDAFDESLWDETWMECPPVSPLFSGSSLCPSFGVGPRSQQVSPKSLCPYVSFSSWKRKFILKAALLFVLLVIPN